MTQHELAHYYFIPTVREGLASFITEAPVAGRAHINARLTPRVDDIAEQALEKTIGLYGPGDVLGFDGSVVSRTDPRKNVWDYEPNFMPLVEFAGEPDLPWRFTPLQAAADGRLTPWITLIVLQASGEFDSLEQRLPDKDKKQALPIRWIKGVNVANLPDLSHAWMWAHVQLTGKDNLNERQIIDAVSLDDLEVASTPADTGHIVARLLCPRRLSASTKYIAFIVPTFKAGQVAAGTAVLGPGETPLDLGWDRTAPPTPKIDLPYYYKFEFATSVRGDFESLVRLLEPRALPKLGKRRMDCSAMAYGLSQCPSDTTSDPHVLELEGALMSPDLEPGRWTNQTPQIGAFRTNLADVINMPVNAPTSGTGIVLQRPPVVPPALGRWHSRQQLVDPNTINKWKDDVNLDPRLRAAAGFGALVVQKEQEPLKASLWDQLGDVDIANELLRRGQLGLEASKGVFKRLGVLGLPAFLWTAAPVFSRVRAPASISPTPTSITHYLNTSAIPQAAFDPAFRRVLRPRGGIRRRQKQLPPPRAGQDMLSRLNTRDIAAAGPPPKLVGMPSMCDVTDAAIARLHSNATPSRVAADKYRIEGRVVRRTNRRPVDGVRVEVWDKDPFFSDLIGGVTTDAQGTFVVEFDQSYFKEWFMDRRPDLAFKVFRHKTQINSAPSSTLRNVAPGTLTIVIEADDTEPPVATTDNTLTIYDFCEAAITPEEVRAATVADGLQLHAQAAEAIAGAITDWLRPAPSQTPEPAVVDLSAVHDAVKAAIEPGRTIPARITKRIRTGPGVHIKGELGLLESEIDFPQPMYEHLAAISQDLILPGVETVPTNTISLVRQNTRFTEAFLLGLNTSFASECLWIGAPVFLATTFFKRFWDVRGLVEPGDDSEATKDITPIASWARNSRLGEHNPRGADAAESAVLLVRGDLLKRYPDTVIYAVESLDTDQPALADFGVAAEDENRVWPIFSGSLPTDLTFLGFDKTPGELCTGGVNGKGYFIVIEERGLSEPRFGFDLAEPEPETAPSLPAHATWWYDMTWQHLTNPAIESNMYIDGSVPVSPNTRQPVWGSSSAVMANICLQRPVRISIHASKMLSATACEV